METENPPEDMRSQVVEKIAALMTVAFGLVAALAWNTAIQEAFRLYFGEQSALAGLLIYAVVVTAIAVGATIWIGRVAGRVKSKVAHQKAGGPGRPMA